MSSSVNPAFPPKLSTRSLPLYRQPCLAPMFVPNLSSEQSTPTPFVDKSHFQNFPGASTRGAITNKFEPFLKLKMTPGSSNFFHSMHGVARRLPAKELHQLCSIFSSQYPCSASPSLLTSALSQALICCDKTHESRLSYDDAFLQTALICVNRRRRTWLEWEIKLI